MIPVNEIGVVPVTVKLASVFQDKSLLVLSIYTKQKKNNFDNNFV